MSIGLQPYRSARHLLSAALLLAIAGCAESVTSPLTDERRDVPQYTSHDTEGGPIILMGIDAEDGGPGAHGPISVYVSVVSSLLDAVTNAGTGVLVIGQFDLHCRWVPRQCHPAAGAPGLRRPADPTQHPRRCQRDPAPCGHRRRAQ